MTDTLVTGVRSGLGRYLQESLRCDGLQRNNSVKLMTLGKRYSTVVHCAFLPPSKIKGNAFSTVVADTLQLTLDMLRLCEGKFIFISTIDVYPQSDKVHDEDERIDYTDKLSEYGRLKLLCEELIKNNTENHFLIRVGLLMGRYMRENNLYRLLNSENAELSLTKDSSFNCVPYSDVFQLIEMAMQQNYRGVVNLTANNTVQLQDIAEKYQKLVRYGQHRYQTGNINNGRLKGLSSVFDKSSASNIEAMHKELM